MLRKEQIAFGSSAAPAILDAAMLRTSALLSVLALLGCGAAPTACQSDLTSYLACGCGCCGGTTPQQVCIESTGKCLEDVIAEDQAARANPGCAMAGCALGVEYVRCAGPGG